MPDIPRLQRVDRLYKKDLHAALDAGVEDQVLYFCCHGHQEGDDPEVTGQQGRLVLSDRPVEASDAWITPSDIHTWLDFNDLTNHPLVFLNACGAGQINSIFYEGFGKTFLGGKACCVIGPQTDMPAVFAGQFARRFFKRFFAGGTENKVGSILLDLRREFYDIYHNPLGLLYSSYRGGEIFLDEGLNAQERGGILA